MESKRDFVGFNLSKQRGGHGELTFYRQLVCDAEAGDFSVVEPREGQGHFHSLLHFDPGHSAVAAEGSDPDHLGVNAAADAVSDSVRAALPQPDLPQAREGELQF